MSKSLDGIIKLKRIGYFRRDLIVLNGCLELELELRCYSLEPPYIVHLFKVSRIVLYPFIVLTSGSLDTNMAALALRLLQIYKNLQIFSYLSMLPSLFSYSLISFVVSFVDISYVIHYIYPIISVIFIIFLKIISFVISFCHMGAAVCLRLVHLFSHLNGSGFLL